MPETNAQERGRTENFYDGTGARRSRRLNVLTSKAPGTFQAPLTREHLSGVNAAVRLPKARD